MTAGARPPVGRGARRRRRAILLLALALAGAVAGTLLMSSPQAAGASPRQDDSGSGNCVEILRDRWKMPQRISPPDEPENYEVIQIATAADERYWVTYCRAGEDWVKRDDPFPYEDADLCVQIFYDPDNHEGQNPPAQLTPVDAIDDWGRFDASGGLMDGGEDNVEYCRDGDGWQRGSGDSNAGYEDRPEGSYEEWSDSCATIIPDGEAPERSTRHPRDLGNVLGDDEDGSSDPDLGHIDTSLLVMYCKQRGTDNWFRVDDARPADMLPEDERWRANEPENGTCVVIPSTWNGEALPQVLEDAAVPYDFGQTTPRSDYEEANGRGSYELTDLMCFANGRWRRGDKLAEGCAGGMMEVDDGFLPAECWGSFPTTNYDIGYDAGAWNHWDRKLYGWWTDVVFTITKFFVQVALWVIGWAFSFDIARYDLFGMNLGEGFRTNITENPGFQAMAIVWFFLIAYAAVNILRGKAGMAAGEFALSFMLLALSAVLIANRSDYMDSTWRLMNAATNDLLVAGSGQDPTTDDRTVDEVIDETQAQLHKVFVEQPYDYLNWGGALSGDCATARNEILARGPHGADDWPRDRMGDAGCDDEKDFNHDPSGTRLGSSIVLAAAAMMVMLVLCGLGFTVVIAKFLAVLLFGLAPFAVVFAGMPGGGRRPFWVWILAIGQAVGAVVGMAFLLAILLLSLDALAESTENVSMVERFAIMLLLVMILAAARKRLLSSSASTAGRMADNLSNMRVGGGGLAWQGATGSRGIDLSPSGKLNQAAWTAAGIGTGLAATWWNRRKSIKGSLKNLRTMEVDKRLADGQPIPVWHGHLGASLVGWRARRRGHGRGYRGPGGAGGPGGGPAGGGPVGGGPAGGGPAGGGPRPAAPRRRLLGGGGRGLFRRGGGAGGGARGPGMLRTRWALTADALHLDRGAEMANAAWRGTSDGARAAWRGTNRGWDRGTSAMGRGAGRLTRAAGTHHPGPGGRPLRIATFEARWTERQGASAHNRGQGWGADRRDELRHVDQRYMDGRDIERRFASSLGPGRRGLRDHERRAAGMRDPRSLRREQRAFVHDYYRDDDAVRLRDQPLVRGVRNLFGRVAGRRRGGGGGAAGPPRPPRPPSP
jgi:hypothetical protein